MKQFIHCFISHLVGNHGHTNTELGNFVYIPEVPNIRGIDKPKKGKQFLYYVKEPKQ